MSEATQAPRRWKPPWGLIGMLPLILAAELTVARHEPKLFDDPLILSWRLGADSSVREAKQAKILCMGDSLVHLGVLPRLLQSRVGKSAYNLASPGSPASASYFLLRKALEAGARPEALVVDFHSNVLSKPPRTTLHFWPELLSFRETLELGWHARDPRLFLATTLAIALPSVRRRNGLREGLLASLRDEPPPSRELMAANRRNALINLGASPHAKRTPNTDDITRSEPNKGWQPHGVNVLYVRKFLELASSRKIPVYWLLPPLSPACQGRLERRGVDERLMQFVLSIQRKYDNVVVVDGRHAGYPTDVFVDANHLDKQGAAELTTTLASIMDRGLVPSGAGRGVVPLPPFRALTSDLPLEDLEESKAIVRKTDDRLGR
ncbi:hypothetical protein [Singulisphaera sp. PoT]|uniref:hypothetical protein n=1 Tax=Singulisphaera sp. PoT TaxID=3411797 RepID=UPI003BF5E281